MFNKMAPKNSGVLGGTDYQLHKSQHTAFAGVMHKILDYTEHRLTKYIGSVSDTQQRKALHELLEKYKKGNAIVAWRCGLPVWLPVVHD